MQENTQTFYHILPNGVRIVHKRTPSPVAYIGVMVGVGTRNERPEENGMAHYIEHCVFKGTAHHSARQIIHAIEGIGGEINAYTTKEETTFYAAILAEHVQLTLHLIAEMILQPSFKKEETDKERMVILDEIESYNDSPSELIYDDFESLVFAGSPLAMPILGNKKTLRHISSKPEYPIRWMKEHYTPERMVVFCQGDVKPEKIFRLAEKEFGSLLPATVIPQNSLQSNVKHVNETKTSRKRDENETKTGRQRNDNGKILTDTRDGTSGSPGITAPATWDGWQVNGLAPDCLHSASYHKHTHQVHAMLGGKAYAIGHDFQLPMFLLNNILGGGSLNSRLNLCLREAKGLVYTVESTYTPLSDTGYWCVYWACDPQDKNECMRLVRAQLDELATKELSESALRNALTQLRGQLAISAQNQENSALAMAKSMLYHNTAPDWQETMRKIEHTDTRLLLRIAQETFAQGNTYILTYE